MKKKNIKQFRSLLDLFQTGFFYAKWYFLKNVNEDFFRNRKSLATDSCFNYYEKFFNNFFEDFGKNNSFYSLINKSEKVRLLEKAELITKKKFQILGFNNYCFSGDIDWHYDFYHSYRWSEKIDYMNKSDKLFSYIDEEVEADIKIPWELSRFHYLVTLAVAYQITDNIVYYDTALSLVQSWIEKNPCGKGINWSNLMEISIRSVNWIFALSILNHKKEIDSELKKSITHYLFLHGQYLYLNIWRDRKAKGNHYLSDLLGLLVIGSFFLNERYGKKWMNYAYKELLSETLFQLSDDGVHYEGSFGYQKLVAEILLLSLIFLEKLKLKIPNDVLQKVEVMVELLGHVKFSNDDFPLIGDYDNGYIFSGLNETSLDAIFHMASLLFHRSDFVSSNSNAPIEFNWLLSNKNLKREDLKDRSKVVPISKKYTNPNFAIMKSDKINLFIVGGFSNSPIKTGHLHNDVFSFVLTYNNTPVFIDPGTYVYTANLRKRKKFRETAAHNTVKIDGVEQNVFDELNAFSFKQYCSLSTIKEWSKSRTNCVFDAEHTGYSRLKNPVVHRRRFELQKGEDILKISDFFYTNGVHSYEWFFHLGHNFDIKSTGNNIYTTILDSKRFLLLKLNDPTETINSEIISGYYSQKYGKKQKVPVIRFKLPRIKGGFQVDFFIKSCK